MQCPKCGRAQPEGVTECAFCGVVFATYRRIVERGDRSFPPASRRPGGPNPAPPQEIAFPDLTDRVLARSRRLESGILHTALRMVLLEVSLALLRAARYVPFSVREALRALPGALLIAAATLAAAALYARIYRLRSRGAARGVLVPGRLVTEPSPLGAGMVPRGEGVGAWSLAGLGIEIALSLVLGGRLPARKALLELYLCGRRQLVTSFLFDDEVAVETERGEVLCLVHRGLWFYPPSPWILRAAVDDPELPALRRRAAEVVARLREHGPLPARAAEPVDRSTWPWVGALLGALVAGLLPVWWPLGWLPVAFFSLLLFLPGLLLGLYLQRSRPRL